MWCWAIVCWNNWTKFHIRIICSMFQLEAVFASFKIVLTFQYLHKKPRHHQSYILFNLIEKLDLAKFPWRMHYGTFKSQEKSTDARMFYAWMPILGRKISFVRIVQKQNPSLTCFSRTQNTSYHNITSIMPHFASALTRVTLIKVVYIVFSRKYYFKCTWTNNNNGHLKPT